MALAIGTQPGKAFAAKGIGDVLHEGMQRRGIPAVAAIAGTSDSVIWSGAFGTRDSGSGIALTQDSIFAIASMTKAITSAGAMQLVEQDKLALDEPASKYLPELGSLQVLGGFDAAGKPILRPARKQVTLRQLLTHTSGFSYDSWHEAMFRFTSSGGDSTHVLAFEPGTKWQYGPGTYWVGRLVEAVSGIDLEKYLQQNVIGPLGMKDTSFILAAEKFERLAGRYQRETNGMLTPAPRTLPTPPASYRGDGGLYSTAPDYLKFTQMILKHGAGPGGVRILKEKTVALMSANGTGSIAAGRLKTWRPSQSGDVDFHPGHDDRYTLAFLMNPEAIPGERAAGSLAWAGIFNTYYWIDPRSNICGVIMMGFLPFADKEAVGLLDEFQRAVYSSRR